MFNNLFFLNDQIGSDEVGTGDFLGPIVVVASFVSKQNIDYLKKIGVKDSKKITDNKILDISKRIINDKKIFFYYYILNNEIYNKIYYKYKNKNKILCLLHNKLLFKLQKKIKINNIFVDLFTINAEKYYEHLKDVKNVVKNIYFKTNAENFFISVAVSSVLARYFFLKEMNNLNIKYKTIIPFGSNNNVDKFVKFFIKKFGIKELKKICKQNFKNYKKLFFK